MQYIKTISLVVIGILGCYYSSLLQAQTAETSLFKRDSSMSRRSILNNPTGGAVLLLEEATIQELISTQPAELTLVLPDEMDGEITLVLKKRQLFTKDFQARSSQNPIVDIPVLDLHYVGFVQNEPSSRVALSLTDKEVSGLIQLETKTIALRRLQANTDGSHVVYNYENHPATPELNCSDTDTLPGFQSGKLGRSTGTIGEPVCLSVRVEVDQDFRGDPAALMNQVANIYEKIGVNMKIAEIYYWNTPSPYSGSTREIISKLQTDIASRSEVAGDLTLLLSGKGNGGRASTVGQVCSPSAVCYSGQNDDVYTVAHEIGHLLAAHHTHACKWNGNNTALDGCGNNAGYGGCEGEDPVDGGTLMSYCHIRSVGVNLDFHPQVADVIYNFVQANSDCTCKDVTEVEPEEEFEEFVEIDGGTDNIVANICQATINNPNACNVDLYTMLDGKKGTLMLTVPANLTTTSPVVTNGTYGLYAGDLLVGKFVGQCGSTVDVIACGTEGIKVQGRVMLEGFYDTYTQLMHQNLLTNNLVSTDNPYLAAPWNFKGVFAVASIPATAVDWVLLMSRDADGKIINQSVGFLSSTGILLDLKGNEGIPLMNSNGNYISIHHRGHMAVMSAHSYTAGTNYDFTSSPTQVMGNGQVKLVGKSYALHAGDFDANGVINNQDYNQWVSKSSLINQYLSADGDGNGVINNKDYNLWISNRSKIGHMPLHY